MDICERFEIVNPIKLGPDLLPEAFTILYADFIPDRGPYKLRVKGSSCGRESERVARAVVTPPKGRASFDVWLSGSAEGILIQINGNLQNVKKLPKSGDYHDYVFDGIKYRIQRTPNTQGPGNVVWNATVFINID